MNREIGEHIFNTAKDANSGAPALLLISFLGLLIIATIIKHKGDDIRSNETLLSLMRFFILLFAGMFIISLVMLVSE